ncbi:multicopper oxidase [Auriscalpium vulgare]|uniref:Multicopper oxidase n=1 Tax=Auriscalpium vulgare TaxID=40419 RepID=A0ACB8RFX0_9AGAM|nr:multicopper oxidase [Auriscalpium vulgare]
MLSHTTLAFLVTSSATVALAAVVSSDIHITNAVLAPDGFSRDTVVAGGVFPAPLIKGNMGDEFQLNVFDDLTDSAMDLATSIHWHGFFQKTTNYADGVSFVTQCPLIPGNSYLYDFSVPGQAGTFWYHSHFANQYCDGLRGPFVVYDPNDPQASLYDVDDETTVITLADWYHYLSTNAPAIPQPSSTLINGAGRYSGATTNPDLTVVGVTAGKRYRFRVINIACDSYFVFSIDGHQLTIIEADGQSTQPLVVDTLQILAGQRYSVVLNANQSPDNYWIRSIPAGGTTTGGLNSAILRYDGANATDPTTSAKTSPVALVETNLHPLVASAVPGTHSPGEADININLAVTAANGLFLVNNQSFTPATGLDGCPYELWKKLHEIHLEQVKNDKPSFDVVGTLTTVFQDIQRHGVDPKSDFAEGWMCPIYKKGERSDIANYRPITLLNTDYKLLTKALAVNLGREASCRGARSSITFAWPKQ